MSDEQKIYVGFATDDDTYSEGVIEALKNAGKEVVVVGRPDEGLVCDSITFIEPRDNTLIPEEPLWVRQQQNKKLWRKK